MAIQHSTAQDKGDDNRLALFTDQMLTHSSIDDIRISNCIVQHNYCDDGIESRYLSASRKLDRSLIIGRDVEVVAGQRQRCQAAVKYNIFHII